MKDRIAIVDYGMANLYSVKRAIEVSGASNVYVSGDATDISNADKLILPGVGAFEDGMQGLRDRNLINTIIDAAKIGKPILGICLGMQMLATFSEEYGTHSGLDVIPGGVKAIPTTSIDGRTIKVPFIGWSPVTIETNRNQSENYLHNIGDGEVYLVHSYQFVPSNVNHVLATYMYEGHRITAAIGINNIIGLQFHPEKSGKVGLNILRNFINTNHN